MLPDMLMLNTPFSLYNSNLTGSGLVMRASQSPCASMLSKGNLADQSPATPGTGRCCSNGICSSWAGAHLVSNGCFLYGAHSLCIGLA